MPGSRLAAITEKGESMFEKRADQFESGDGRGVGKSAYETPVAEWHDLRVITLGGSPGEGDSGAVESQQPAGGASPNGMRGSNHYDDNPDDQFGNYV
jgi:hypothetical protein